MTVATAEIPPPPNVVTALYLRTKTLHVEAERTGIIRDLLRLAGIGQRIGSTWRRKGDATEWHCRTLET